MNVNFNDHVQVTDKNDCLLFFAIAGNKNTIKAKLEQMIREIDDSYGKPMQGIVSSFNCVSHVITPIWNGEEY